MKQGKIVLAAAILASCSVAMAQNSGGGNGNGGTGGGTAHGAATAAPTEGQSPASAPMSSKKMHKAKKPATGADASSVTKGTQ
jgi:hypothetical protein